MIFMRKIKKQANTSIKWRSKSYTILDLIGYVQPIKNLTIRLAYIMALQTVNTSLGILRVQFVHLVQVML